MLVDMMECFFFYYFNRFVVLTSHLDAYTLRSNDFCADKYIKLIAFPMRAQDTVVPQ